MFLKKIYSVLVLGMLIFLFSSSAFAKQALRDNYFSTLSPSDTLFSQADSKIIGRTHNDYAGTSVSAQGDFNGDGKKDILMGAPGYDGAEPDSGIAYILYGPVNKNTTVDNANVIFSAESIFNANTGSSVTAADVNKDGYDDAIISAPSATSDIYPGGVVYIVYGKSNLTSLSLSAANVKLVGQVTGDAFGHIVNIAGDVNKDGYPDILVGAPYHNHNALSSSDIAGTERSGAAYLFTMPLVGTIAAGTAKAKFIGSEYTRTGYAVASAGDVNKDGYSDILIGAPDTNNNSGSAYIMYGPISGIKNLTTQASVTFDGEGQGSLAGYAVASAGDVNKDGYSDILIGAVCETAQVNGEISICGNGTAYLHYGKVLSGHISLANADAKFIGEAQFNHAGNAFATGDINGDGYADIVIGASCYKGGGTAECEGSGAVYVWHGSTNKFLGEYALANAHKKYSGTLSKDRAGVSVSLGDMNTDGLADLLIGALGVQRYKGAAYIIYGSK